jgi:integrase
VVARHRVRQSSFGKYQHRVRRITSTLGPLRVRGVTREQVATWQSDLPQSGLAPKTAADVRVTLRQVLEQAVINDLIASNPVDRVAAPRLVRSAKRALVSQEARRLVRASAMDRLGAAVAVLFVHGWRVSEALGLAWEDLDLDASTASVRRAAVYVDGGGVTLGATKTAGATGLHHLSPGVIEALRRHRDEQAAERLSSERWQSHRYDGRAASPVFTNRSGGLVNRQAVTKAITRAAQRAGLDPTGLAIHTGRRTTVTVLYTEVGLDLSDIARYVGHAGEATTSGYVRHLGERPKTMAARAAAVLDPTTESTGSS